MCTVYSFFSGRYLANLRGKARGESKYYLHIYYMYYYIVLYINTLYIIIYIIIKNIIIHNNSFSHSLPPIGGHEKNCNLYTLYTFHSSLPRGGVQKKNCNLYTLYTFRSSLPRGGVQKKNCNLYTLYTFRECLIPASLVFRSVIRISDFLLLFATQASPVVAERVENRMHLGNTILEQRGFCLFDLWSSYNHSLKRYASLSFFECLHSAALKFCIALDFHYLCMEIIDGL